jgi:hypothetical protein
VALTSGDNFHGTTTASGTSTSGNGFHVTAKGNGGVGQRQRLPHHGEGQWQRRPVATTSTSRQRLAAASTSGVFLFFKTDFSCRLT